MKPRPLALLVSCLSLLALLVSPLASPALAEPNLTFTVNANTDMVDFLPGDGVCETAADNDMCTLRAAIMEANARVGEDSITLPSSTYQLTISGADEDLGATGDLDILESLTINAAGAETPVIEAQGLGDRALDISGSAAEVTLNRVKIQNGSTTGDGGGIKNHSNLTLINSSLYTNHADGKGGAIYSTGLLSFHNVNIFLNSAEDDGGGVFTYSDIDSPGASLTYNTAGGDGGALYLGIVSNVYMSGNFFDDNQADGSGGAIYNAGELVMEGGTITEGEAGLLGGGIFAGMDSQTTLKGVLISYNHAVNNGGGLFADAGSVLTGQGLTLDHNSIDFHGGALYVFDSEAYLSNCVLSNNTASSHGGAIAISLGTMTIEASTIISNTASGEGGGIYNGGSLSLIGATLIANEAQTGGGIANYNNASTIENSTISGNRSKANGGGIYDHSILSIYNSTITANTANSDTQPPSGTGGGVYIWETASTLLSNTILFDNHHRKLFDWIDDDCFGTLHSGDYNLIGTLSDCIMDKPPGHDLIGADPLLGGLADNGGPTQTHALLGHSPAIDGGNPQRCRDEDGIPLITDQRGVIRHQDGDRDGLPRCDIGAYEYPGDIYVYLPVTVR